MERARTLALSVTSFLFGAALVAGFAGSGCGGGGAEAQHLPIAFVDITHAGLQTVSARVGNATLRGTLAGHVTVNPTTGVANGQLVATFDDGLQVDVTFQNGAVRSQVPGTTALIPNDDTDAVFINGDPESMRDHGTLFFQALQQDERPSMLPPQSQVFAPYWLMRYTWAWFINAFAAVKDNTNQPIGQAGTPLWIKLDCAVSVPPLVAALQSGSCEQLELLCTGREVIMVGGIFVPCSWILAMCVNGQFVGANTAYESWLFLVGR